MTISNAARAKNITVAKRTERKAADANAATLASARKAKPPAPKPELEKGSGALIGVAKGATDGQPHTKRAVEEARKAASPKGRREEALATLRKLTEEAQRTPLMVSGVLFETAKQANAKRRAVRALLEPFLAEPKTDAPAKTPKAPAKAATPKTPKADAPVQTITVVDKAFTFGAEGSKRRQSWNACKAAKTTAEYKAKGGAVKYLARWVAAKAIKLSA